MFLGVKQLTAPICCQDAQALFVGVWCQITHSHSCFLSNIYDIKNIYFILFLVNLLCLYCVKNVGVGNILMFLTEASYVLHKGLIDLNNHYY